MRNENIKKMLRNLKGWMGCGLLLATALVYTACNKPFVSTLDETYPEDTLGTGFAQRKVLYIVLDGVRGNAVQNAGAPAITELSDNAVYTLDGLGDYERIDEPFSDENAWSNMLTGVSQTKHGVDDQDFSNNSFSDFPSLFTRVKENRPGWRTSAFTSSPSMKQYLLEDATLAEVAASDAAVKAAALDELANEDPAIMLVHFNGVKLAGDQFGYDSDVAEYNAAIREVDQHIRDITDALEERPSYQRENWMIIVASSKGGDITDRGSDLSAYGDPKRNNMVFFHNTKFRTLFVPKPADTRGAGPYFGKAVRLYGNPTNTAVGGARVVVQNKAGEGNQDVFNIGNESITVEAKVRFFPKAGNNFNYSFPPFLSKLNARTGNTLGWSLFRNGSKITFFVGTGAAKMEFASVRNMNDSNWHTLAMVMYKEGAKVVGKLFIDGLLDNSGEVALADANVTINSPAPVTLGYQPEVFSSDFIDMLMTDVRIWKAALPDEVIFDYSCYPEMPPPSHPYHGSLVGFWSLREGEGDVITDQTGNGRNAQVITGGTGTIQWRPFSEVSYNVCPEPTNDYYRMVPNTMDIPFQVYQWMGINVPQNWGLDGKSWISSYLL